MFNFIKVIRLIPAQYHIVKFRVVVIGMIRINIPIAVGRKLFHVRYIRWSYRIRGRVARIQIKSELMMRADKGAERGG